MSSLAAETLLTPEEYLASERKATVKSEYLSGQILARSGANHAHNLITLDIATELNIQLRGQGVRFTRVICTFGLTRQAPTSTQMSLSFATDHALRTMSLILS